MVYGFLGTSDIESRMAGPSKGGARIAGQGERAPGGPIVHERCNFASDHAGSIFFWLSRAFPARERWTEHSGFARSKVLAIGSPQPQRAGSSSIWQPPTTSIPDRLVHLARCEPMRTHETEALKRETAANSVERSSEACQICTDPRFRATSETFRRRSRDPETISKTRETRLHSPRFGFPMPIP